MRTNFRLTVYLALEIFFAGCLLTEVDGQTSDKSILASPDVPAHPACYSEALRPQYHFTPEKNWMNDPDGLVGYAGEYHLFYQYNPLGNIWDHMSWGHAVSKDLIHWQHLPVALPEADGVMIFTGSAVVDWNNTSGFGMDGNPPLVAIYAGYRRSDNVQFQCIAYSNDKGRTWTKYAGNPVINLNSKDFRDPKVQWHQATGRCLSTAGARPNPLWLQPLLHRHDPIYCGFDADPTGDQMAAAMIALHPAIKRLRPPAHD